MAGAKSALDEARLLDGSYTPHQNNHQSSGDIQ